MPKLTLEQIDAMPESNEKAFEYFNRIMRLNQMIIRWPTHKDKYNAEIEEIKKRLKVMLPNTYRFGIHYAMKAKSKKELLR